ncbi:hypothetical protein KKD52_00605, partial [Myxococcota bacterium]|nr:hypothetical protein [Myxococcota bacterium]
MNTFFQSTIILSILSTLLLATACDDSSSSSSTCATGEVRCEGRCIDPLTDRGFCGAAEACEENPGTPCAAGFLCEAGQCVLSCQAGLIDCDGTCIDPTTDRLHCGASSPCDQSPGVACGDGLLCDGAGACTTVCTQGRVECGGTCIDPATDRLHCGAADPCDQNPGLACDDGYLCDAGQCVLSCQDDLIECGGICIDPATDRLHCGAADPCDQNPGLACGDGYLCDAGQCVLSCRAGFIECDGACIDPATDRLHCGAADPCDQNPGLACGDGYLCDGTGGCALSCQENLVECDGTCIDPATDRLHCGAADPCDQNPGLACGDGYLCDGTGGCALSCQENLVECDGTCIDPATDRFHCGASDPCDTNPGFACEDGYLCDGDGGCALSCQENLV